VGWTGSLFSGFFFPSWLPSGSPLRLIRTFGDEVSVLNYLQPVSTKLKIALKSML